MTDATRHPNARLLDIWCEALAKRLGRTAQSIKDDGWLESTDFHHKVSIQYADGLSMIYRDALALVSVSRQHGVGFTLNCGYLQEPLTLGMDLMESDIDNGERVMRRPYLHRAEA